MQCLATFVDAIVPEVQKYQVARAKSRVKTLGELLVEQCEVYKVYMYNYG